MIRWRHQDEHHYAMQRNVTVGGRLFQPWKVSLEYTLNSRARWATHVIRMLLLVWAREIENANDIHTQPIYGYVCVSARVWHCAQTKIAIHERSFFIGNQWNDITVKKVSGKIALNCYTQRNAFICFLDNLQDTWNEIEWLGEDANVWDLRWCVDTQTIVKYLYRVDTNIECFELCRQSIKIRP